MKKILYFFIVFVLITGCAKGQNKEDIDKLCDSLDSMVFWGTMRPDTAMLERALELSDYLLSVDTTNIGKRHYYQQRSMVLGSLGRIDESMVNAERAVITLHENNPLRLIFFSAKYLRENKKDLADYYVEKTISVCDSSLNEEYNEDMAINKVKAIYLRDGERKAKECLYELLKNHHDSQMLKALYEDWDNWARMNNEELQLLNIGVEK